MSRIGERAGEIGKTFAAKGAGGGLYCAAERRFNLLSFYALLKLSDIYVYFRLYLFSFFYPRMMTLTGD